MLHADERLDDLECNGLKIIQNKKGYTFTTDAVLLANIAYAGSSERVVDLGTGSGVIALLMSQKTKAKELVGLELQERLADMASRSVRFNNLEDRVKIVLCDLREAHRIVGQSLFDVAVCNPPYMTFKGDKSVATEKDICKREVFLTLNEAAESASRLLKFGGRLYIIIKGDRVADLICALRNNGIEPKRLIPVQPTPEKNIDTVVIEGRKGGKPGLRFEKPIVVLDKEGNYNEEARRFYNK